MTVMRVVGSSLEEAWGEELPHSSPPSETTQKKKRSSKSKTRGLEDIMSFETYSKTPYSRTMKPLPETDAEERDDDEKSLQIPSTFKSSRAHTNPNLSATEHFLETQQNREKQHLDLAMYVFSGVALIFILEQFIQIGKALGR